MKREDGSTMMLNNIYTENINTDKLGKSQLRKPGVRSAKNDSVIIEATN
jgi:hypothetical protein